jgi:capsular polysaccharide transport system ATP-binding protein
MIYLDDVSIERKFFTRKQLAYRQLVLLPTSLAIPTHRKVALLASDDEHGRDLILDAIAGKLLPTTGRIIRDANISYPAFQTGAFDPEQSVKDAIAFVARLYGLNPHETVEAVSHACLLGRALDRPFGALPIPLKKRIAFLCCYSIPFDVYLLSEGGFGSWRTGRDLEYRIFKARALSAGFIVTARSDRFVLEHCDSALVLMGARLYFFENPEEGLEIKHKFGRSQSGSPRVIRRKNWFHKFSTGVLHR